MSGDKKDEMTGIRGGVVSVVLSAALMGCAGSGGGQRLTGDVRASFDADWSINQTTKCTSGGETSEKCIGGLTKAGDPCPAGIILMAALKEGSTVTIENADKKNVATAPLTACRLGGKFDATLQFSAKLPRSDFYTVKIEGQGGEQTYSRADLERMKWNVSLKAS